MHHQTNMHQGQRLRIIDICIMDTCNRVKDRGSNIHTCIIHICMCIIHIKMHNLDHRYNHHIYMHHGYMHHGYMHHQQSESRIYALWTPSWTQLRGSHGLSARRARRTKSSRPEGPQTSIYNDWLIMTMLKIPAYVLHNLWSQIWPRPIKWRSYLTHIIIKHRTPHPRETCIGDLRPS